MKSKIVRGSLVTLLSLLLAFVGQEDPFFTIKKKDVQLKIPAHFPDPKYDFSTNPLTPKGFELGTELFYDPLLSKDSSVSCGSCHQQYAAFAHIDHALAHGIGGRIGNRNVPTLQNLIWKESFMWDGGINHLEVQAIAPLTNPLEMDETLANIIAKLNARSDYRNAFYAAYQDSTANSEHLLKSLAQFMGLMISANSKYDQYQAGLTEFTPEEENGLALFRKKCASCHTEPLFTSTRFANNGLEVNPRLNELGRATITGNQEQDFYRFKVPSLRNVTRTFPYMHDGRFSSIKAVLDHYADTANYSAYADTLMDQIGPLSEADINDLAVFLSTLTDKTFLYDRRFADPNFQRATR